jgi:hypothetical protein
LRAQCRRVARDVGSATGRSSVRAILTTGTGASGEDALASPNQYRSSIVADDQDSRTAHGLAEAREQLPAGIVIGVRDTEVFQSASALPGIERVAAVENQRLCSSLELAEIRALKIPATP